MWPSVARRSRAMKRSRAWKSGGRSTGSTSCGSTGAGRTGIGGKSCRRTCALSPIRPRCVRGLLSHNDNDPLQILLVFVEVPVRIEIAIDVKRPKFEDGFAALQAPPGASNLHAILEQVTASAFDHPRGNRISLGQVVGIVEIRRVIGQIGGTLLKRFALFRAQSLQGLVET